MGKAEAAHREAEQLTPASRGAERADVARRLDGRGIEAGVEEDRELEE